jgi:hypothetical protein
MKKANSIYALIRMVMLLCVGGVISADGFLILPASGQIYVAQTAQGAGDGSSAANAQSLAWLNNAANWNNGVGTVQPGTTVFLVGTFTNELTVSGSGTPGNPITIYFEPNAEFSAPYWLVQWWGGGAITINTKNYIVIDGGQNGVIQATANGTGLANQQSSVGVGAASSSFLTVKNLTVENMYVRTGTTDEKGTGAGIQDVCTEPPSFITAFTVTNCIITQAATGIDCDYGVGSSNYTFIGNTISGCNWAGRCGDRNNASLMTDLVIANNKISDFTNWNDTLSDDYHHNGFYGWAESGGVLNGVYVYGNTIGPNFGGQYCTSGVFFSGQVKNVLVYNNLFLCNPGDGPSNGLITEGFNNGYGGAQIYNNTFIGGGSYAAINIGSGNNTYTVENNLAFNCTFVLDNGAANSTLVADYNIGYDLVPGQGYSQSPTSTSSFQTFAQWQSLGYDLHGSTNNPNLNASYVPQSPSSAIGTGTNLQSIFSADALGNLRPTTSSGWTIGAYQAASSGSITVTNAPSTIVVTPAIQSFGVVPVGSITDVVLTVQNTGVGVLTGSATVPPPYDIVSGGSYTLTPGQSQVVTISFNPTAIGHNVQAVTFSGGSGTNVLLIGVGVVPPPLNLQAH